MAKFAEYIVHIWPDDTHCFFADQYTKAMKLFKISVRNGVTVAVWCKHSSGYEDRCYATSDYPFTKLHV